MNAISEHLLNKYKDIKPAYRRIYLILKEALLEGKAEFSEKLSEESLAQQLGVSRTPLRRALDDLRKEGLITDEDDDAMNHSISRKEMRCLLDYDLILETNAARLAAYNTVSPEDIALLCELNNRIRSIDEHASYNSEYEKDLMAVRDAHLQFHLMVARLSKNHYIYEEVSRVRTKMRQFTAKKDPFPCQQTPYIAFRYVAAPIHDEIIEAIRNHDGDTAYSCMYTDIFRSRSAYFNSYLNPLVIHPDQNQE